MVRLPKIQRLAMEHGANLVEWESGWFWQPDSLETTNGPFDSASAAAYDFLNKELDQWTRQRRALRAARSPCVA